MGFIEKLRQIQEEERKKSRQQEAEVRQIEEERKSRSLQMGREAQDQNKKLKDELKSTLEVISARQLLQQVRDEVWKVGDVDSSFTFKEKEERFPAFAMLALRFHYKTAIEIIAYHYRKEPLGGWSGDPFGSSESYNTGMYSVGTKETILAVKAYRWFDNRLRIEANSTSDIAIWSSTDAITKDSLEQLLFKECIQRTRSQYLPLQLQTKGQEDIKRLVPLHRRLFR